MNAWKFSAEHRTELLRLLKIAGFASPVKALRTLEGWAGHIVDNFNLAESQAKWHTEREWWESAVVIGTDTGVSRSWGFDPRPVWRALAELEEPLAALQAEIARDTPLLELHRSVMPGDVLKEIGAAKKFAERARRVREKSERILAARNRRYVKPRAFMDVAADLVKALFDAEGLKPRIGSKGSSGVLIITILDNAMVDALIERGLPFGARPIKPETVFRRLYNRRRHHKRG